MLPGSNSSEFVYNGVGEPLHTPVVKHRLSSVMLPTKKRSKSKTPRTRTPRRKSLRNKKKTFKGEYYSEYFVSAQDSAQDDPHCDTSVNISDTVSVVVPLEDTATLAIVSKVVAEAVDEVVYTMETFPESVVSVNTKYVKEIEFARTDDNNENQCNWLLLNNIFKLNKFYSSTLTTDPAEGNRDVNKVCYSDVHQYDEECLPDEVQQKQDIKEQENNKKMEKVLFRKDQELADALLKNKKMGEWLFQKDQKIKTLNMTVEQLQESNTYRREVVRLEEIIEINERELKELKEQIQNKEEKIKGLEENVSYFMNVNTCLKNKIRVDDQTHTTVDADVEETDKLIQELNNILKSIEESIQHQETVVFDADVERKDLNDIPRKTASVYPLIPSSLRWSSNNPQSAEISPDEQGRKNVLPVPPVRPGSGTYTDAVVHGKSAMVVSTSITKGIDVNKFKEEYMGRVSFHRFHGGHVRHIKNYIATHLAEEQPDVVIIQVGGNDLPSGKNKRHSIPKIADDIMEMAEMCKRYGVTRVCISSVLPREDFYLQLRIRELNKLLMDLCTLNSYEFMLNSNVVLSKHVHWDGVHLNSYGNKVLFNNLLKGLSCAV